VWGRGGIEVLGRGKTREEAEEKMQVAIEMHVRGLIAVPEPQSFASYVSVQ
jgi:predicted RNase H-like HicB family nuclease